VPPTACHRVPRYTNNAIFLARTNNICFFLHLKHTLERNGANLRIWKQWLLQFSSYKRTCIQTHEQLYRYTNYSARAVGHYVGSPVPLFARPKPPLPVPVCSMRAGVMHWPVSTSACLYFICALPTFACVCAYSLSSAIALYPWPPSKIFAPNKHRFLRVKSPLGHSKKLETIAFFPVPELWAVYIKTDTRTCRENTSMEIPDAGGSELRVCY